MADGQTPGYKVPRFMEIAGLPEPLFSGYWKQGIVEAKTWEGSIVIHILPNAVVGIDTDIYMLLDLWHGDCRSIRPVSGKIAEDADYMMTGQLEELEAVIKGELETVKAMMQGKLKLDGQLPNIVRHIRAATRMVELTKEIDTKFPTKLSKEEIEGFRNLIQKLRTEFGE